MFTNERLYKCLVGGGGNESKKIFHNEKQWFIKIHEIETYSQFQKKKKMYGPKLNVQEYEKTSARKRCPSRIWRWFCLVCPGGRR